MSDGFLAAFIEGSPEEAERALSREVRQGRAGEVVDALGRRLAGDDGWRRERVLERLRTSGLAGHLVPHFAGALRDEASAGRRNAARSALAALASPGAPGCDAAAESLERMLEEADDPDARILAATALGEATNPRARAPLERRLSDPEANVRSAAAEALGMLGDSRAVPALSEALDAATFWTRAAIVFALGRLGEPSALPALGRAVRDPLLASTASAAIGDIGDPRGIEFLRPALEGEGEARSAALEAVATIYGGNPGIEVPEWLRTAVAANAEGVLDRFRETDSLEAARLLGIMATPAAIEALLEALRQPDQEILAEAGLVELPAEERARIAIEQLEAPGEERRAVLLRILPPITQRTSLERVVDLLGNDDPETRAAAADLLARSDRGQTLELLTAALEWPDLRLGAAIALGRLGTQSCEPLLGLLRDPDPRIRAAAASGLARCPEASVSDLARALEAEEDPTARNALIAAIGELDGKDAVPALVTKLLDEDDSTRFALAQALGRTRREEAFRPLLQLLIDPMPEVRAAALNALGDLDDERSPGAIGGHLRESDRDMRRTAARALERLSHAVSVEDIDAALNNEDREVRRTAVEALTGIGGSEAVRALEERIRVEPDPEVRAAASRALLALAPPDREGA